MKTGIFKIIALFLICLMAACVPTKQFEDMKGKEKECRDENDKLKSDNASLTAQVAEQLASINDLQKKIAGLSKDADTHAGEMAKLQTRYGELSKSYDKLLVNNEKML